MAKRLAKRSKQSCNKKNLETNTSENFSRTVAESNNSYFKKIVWLGFLLLALSTAFLIPEIYLKNQKIAFADFLFPIVFGFWLIGLFLGKFNFRWHKFYWLLSFYFLAMCFSTAFSEDFPQSLIKLAGEIYLLGLAVLTFNLVRTEKNLKQIIFFWLIGTSITCLIAIITLFLFYLYPEHWILNYTTSIYGAVPVGNYPRLKSTFVSASMFCNYLSVSLAMLFVAKSANLIVNKIFFPLIVVILICALFTFSSGLGGIALVLGIWFWAYFRDSKKRISHFFLLGTIFFAVSFSVMNLFALQPYSTAPYSINLPFFNAILFPSPRLLVWTESLQTFSQNFFFGKGLGLSVCEVLFENTDGNYSLLTDAHNIFISVAAQNGIFGLLAITAIIIYFLNCFFRTRFNEDFPSISLFGLRLAFLSAFVFQGLTGSFEDTRHLWILIGLIPSANSLLQNKKDD